MSSPGTSKQESSPSTGHVFISHSTKDDPTVAAISRALRSLEIETWTDSRRFSGGDKLEKEVEDAIDRAHHFIAVLSLNAVNSKWVKREIDYALNVEKGREDGFKVISVLIPPIESGSLGLYFGQEPVAVKFDVGPAGIDKVLPRLMEALGHQLPVDPQQPLQIETTPIADLILELTDPTMALFDGKYRATANARLIYDPPEGSLDVESPRYRLTAPLGPIETGDLSWYLERYINWPTGVFQERAEQIVEKLPQWGRLIYDSVNENVARNALEAWKAVPKETSRRFTILVDQDLVDGSSEEETAKAMEAATLLLGLPWELIHDEKGYLFLGRRSVRVRRKLPNRELKEPIVTNPPLRVLLVSPAARGRHRRLHRPTGSAPARWSKLFHVSVRWLNSRSSRRPLSRPCKRNSKEQPRTKSPFTSFTSMVTACSAASTGSVHCASRTPKMSTSCGNGAQNPSTQEPSPRICGIIAFRCSSWRRANRRKLKKTPPHPSRASCCRRESPR